MVTPSSSLRGRLGECPVCGGEVEFSVSTTHREEPCNRCATVLWIRSGAVGVARSVIEVPLRTLAGRDVDHMERRLLRSSLESKVLILDLGQVEFICAEGWATLARSRRQIVAGGDVHLHALRPEVRRAFEALRLDRDFEVV